MAKNTAPSFEEISASLARMGATALASIESIRSRITALRARRSEIEGAPCTPEVLRMRAESIVSDALNEFRSSMTGDLLAGPAARFSDNRATNAVRGVPALALMAAVNRDGLVEALVADALSAAASLGGSPVSEGERATLLADVDRDLLRAEVEEESFIRQLEAAGLGASIGRRSGCNPGVVLAYDAELRGFLEGAR